MESLWECSVKCICVPIHTYLMWNIASTVSVLVWQITGFSCCNDFAAWRFLNMCAFVMGICDTLRISNIVLVLLMIASKVLSQCDVWAYWTFHTPCPPVPVYANRIWTGYHLCSFRPKSHQYLTASLPLPVLLSALPLSPSQPYRNTYPLPLPLLLSRLFP